MNGFPEFDDKIADNLKKSSLACYENGKDLLEDANILYENGRYSRSISLAILSEEEFSKAMMLHLSAIHGRWDEELFNGIKCHGTKQAVSGALSEVMRVLIAHLSREKRSFIPTRLDIKSHVEEEAVHAKRTFIKKKKKDKRKQDAQFVSINKLGLLKSIPKKYTRNDAAADYDNAVRFKAYLEAMYGMRTDDDPLFRGKTSMQYSFEGGDTILYHESGITITMKPFAWLETGCPADKVTMNPWSVLRELATHDPNNLSREQQYNLARIYKAYDFPSQIKAEGQRIGLKCVDYLNEVEGLIKGISGLQPG